MPRSIPESRQVDCLRSLAEAEAFAPAWRELEDGHATSLDWFQTSGWCLNWLRHLGHEGIAPRILVLRDGGEAIAVWPLMIETERFGLRILRSLGDPHTQYSGILCRNGTLEPAHVELLRSALLSLVDADAAVIKLVPADSPLARVLPAGSCIEALGTSASVLSLAGFRTAADYVARLSKARRRSRSRRSKGLAERGTVSFRALQPDHPDYARILTRAMAFKKSWLARTGRVSLGLSMPGHAAFLAGIGNGPVLFELAVNGETIAAELGFLRNRHYYSYLGSFDWAWRDLSPGKAQMDQALEWLIAQGAEAYDLLAHRTSYKDSWSDTEIPLHGHVVEITTRGAIYARCWINTARPALKRAMSSIPEEYRAGLQIMMKQDIPFLA